MMQIGKILSLITILLIFSSFKFEKRKVFKGVSISLPSNFVLMTDDELATKYPSAQKPLTAYTSYERNADFGMNLARSYWDPKDLGLVKDFYKSNLLGIYDSVTFIKEWLITIQGRDFVNFEVVTYVYGDPELTINPAPVAKYSNLAYTIVNGKTLIFNFTCSKRLLDRYQNISRAIILSIKISKKFE